MHLFRKPRINNPSKNTVTNFCHFIAILSSFCIKINHLSSLIPIIPNMINLALNPGICSFLSHICVFDAFLTYILYKNTLFDTVLSILPFNFFVIPFVSRETFTFVFFCAIISHETLLLPCFALQLFHLKHCFHLVLPYNCST